MFDLQCIGNFIIVQVCRGCRFWKKLHFYLLVHTCLSANLPDCRHSRWQLLVLDSSFSAWTKESCSSELVGRQWPTVHETSSNPCWQCRFRCPPVSGKQKSFAQSLQGLRSCKPVKDSMTKSLNIEEINQINLLHSTYTQWESSTK